MAATKVWTNKAGEKIPIREMSDRYLMNAIRTLKKLHEGQICDAQNALALLHDGTPTYYILDGEIAKMTKEGPSYCFEIYKELLVESDRRNLTLPK